MKYCVHHTVNVDAVCDYIRANPALRDHWRALSLSGAEERVIDGVYHCQSCDNILSQSSYCYVCQTISLPREAV